jgi:hypothetical protein
VFPLFYLTPVYCGGLLKALRCGTRKTHLSRSTVELWLLSNEGLNNHDNKGTIEDVSWAMDTETGSHIRDTKTEPFKEVTSIWFYQNLPHGEN